MVPDWLYHAIEKMFAKPHYKIKRESITMMKVNLKPTKSEQIVAFINLDMVNSLFIIFEKQGEDYEEVYCKKWYIDSVEVIDQLFGQNQVLIVKGSTSGTGYVEGYHYVIRYTPEGYKDVWKKLSRYFVSHYIAPTDIKEIGTINFDSVGDELYYSLIKIEPKLEVISELYVYNDQKHQYELKKTYS